jgi:nitrate/TMAO reductase-like tetraheme cytochrome c subunit
VGYINSLGEVLLRYLVSVLLIALFALPASAGYREIFEKEFLSQPWSGERLEESACIVCHSSETMEADLQKIPQEWKTSWHFQNNVSCHDCHGGDHEDASMSMSHQRGFTGSPKYAEVPDFCGKCHIGILNNYTQSGHGQALLSSGTGPNCVTCHGAHNIQKASIDIIYGRRCTQCHSYERAKVIKQALFMTESKMQAIEGDLRKLKAAGVVLNEGKKTLFRTQAEFRTLFHTVDVSLVNESTDKFTKILYQLEEEIKSTFDELRFRKNFSAFLSLLFIGIAVVISILSKTYKD